MDTSINPLYSQNLLLIQCEGKQFSTNLTSLPKICILYKISVIEVIFDYISDVREFMIPTSQHVDRVLLQREGTSWLFIVLCFVHSLSSLLEQ